MTNLFSVHDITPRRYRRILRLPLFIIIVVVSINSPAQASICGKDYVVKSGNSLSRIAYSTYSDAQKWTVIYNVNRKIIGENPNLIQVGQQLRIPCLEIPADNIQAQSTESTASPSSLAKNAVDDNNSQSTGLANSDVQDSLKGDAIRFLTGNDYAPFTDQDLPNQGLITDIVATALNDNPAQPEFAIDWVDDWSLHLEGLLSSLDYDMGFPWFKPDCDTTPEEYRCQNFVFSNPVFEMLILLFTDKSRPLVFNTDEDIKDAVLCRPNGYFTHDLEKDGRLWLTNKVVELKQPDTIKDCFDMLVNGSVDAVALNEFTGRSAIAEFGLENKVVALENKPLSIEGLRVVVHKDHPRSKELMSLFNSSMAKLQLSEEYSNIIDTHFRHYWASVD